MCLRKFTVQSEAAESTDREMVPVKSTTDVLSQYFAANDGLLSPILKVFARCTRSVHATRNALCFQSVCRCHKWQSCNSPVYLTFSRTAPHTPTTACAAVCILTSCCKVEDVSEGFSIVEPTVACTRARFAPH
jgi:hypothetical protein